MTDWLSYLVTESLTVTQLLLVNNLLTSSSASSTT